jgi:hypothetical protein
MRSQYSYSEDVFAEERHPSAKRRHVREVWLQIALPLIIGVALGGLGLFALLSATPGNVTRASQLATVVLAIPLLLMGLIFLIVVVAGIWLLGEAMNWIPSKTIYVHRFMQRANQAAQRGADLVARPVLAVESWSKALSGFWRQRFG